MKVASTFRNVSHDRVNNPFKAVAVRGEKDQATQVKVESTLRSDEVSNNALLNSVDDRSYAESSEKTTYLTDTVKMGIMRTIQQYWILSINSH